MNRSIPRRLGDSRQFRPLSCFARLVAERLWRRGVVQHWASEDELIDYMQQCGLFTGPSRLAEWPPVFDELTGSGFLVDEGDGLVLPILTADTLRPTVEQFPAPDAAAEKLRREKAFSMHLLRLARRGDPRAIVAKYEGEDPAQRAEARAMRGVLEAEYNHPARARGTGNRGPVTTPTTPSTASGNSPSATVVTSPVTVTRALAPSGSLSPSPDPAASTAGSEREEETPDAREPTPLPRSVTAPAVTSPAPVTAPRTAEQLAQEAPAVAGQFFLDVMAARVPGTFPSQIDVVDAAHLGRMIVARGASESDLRAIGSRWEREPEASLAPFAFEPSVAAAIAAGGPVPVPFSLLLGARVGGAYDGARFGTLLRDTREWVKGLVASGARITMRGDPPFRVGRPGVVGAVDAFVAKRETGSG